MRIDLVGVALHLVPPSWRATVRQDLDDEARAQGRGQIWRGAQVVRIAIGLRWTTAGEGAMFDLRSAFRSVWRARWFSAGAAVTFALGIGVNTAVFSSVDRILFRSLPYEQPDELVLLRRCNPDGFCAGSFPAAIAFHGGRRLQTVGEMAAAGLSSTLRQTQVPGELPPLTLTGASANLLRVLGVRPFLGRDVSDEDVRERQMVVLLSYDAWQQRFGAAPDVIGRTLWSSGSTATVIGVLPRGFFPPGWVSGPTWHGLIVEHRGWSTIQPAGAINPPVARLRPGATLEAARAEVTALAAALEAEQTTPPRPGTQLAGVRVDGLERELFSRWRDYAWLVVAAAGLVLLMACANLAGLLLARGRSRERDAALRTALGASAARIIGTSIAETALICLAGAGIAVLVLVWTSQAIAAVLPPLFRQYMTDAIDPRVLLFALAAAFVCAVVAGAWPGARAARLDVVGVLQQGAGRWKRGRLRGGRSLLALETALGVLLVVGAAGAVRSLANYAGEDLGFEPADLYRVAAGATPRLAPAESLARYEQVLDAVLAHPGVIAVAGSDSVVTSPATPMRGFSSDRTIRGGRYEITSGYFGAIGSRLISGREFTEDEVRSRAAVGIVDLAAVRTLWPDRHPTEVPGLQLPIANESPRLIVGVVPNLLEYYGATPTPSLYVPLGADPSAYGPLLIRMAPGVVPSAAALQQTAVGIIGQAAVTITPATEGMDVMLADPRFRAVLLALFAVCALVLAAAGLYALASFEAATRRSEIGVRLALGASARRLRRLILGETLRPVLLGSIVGLVAAYWAASFVQAFWYQVDARDPWTFALAAIVLGATALVAAWLPARRAARTDPAIVLRST